MMASDVGCGAIAHIPIAAKNMANTPSSTMTRKIDFTTEAVVCCAERLGAALHLQALDAGDDADHSAMNGALIMPTMK